MMKSGFATWLAWGVTPIGGEKIKSGFATWLVWGVLAVALFFVGLHFLTEQ